MKLMTKEILDKIPPLYSQEKVADPIVWAKFFFPIGRMTWFATEYSPEDRQFFGWVKGNHPDDDELGYFSLDEMEEVRVHGLGIERDMYFDPKPLSWVKSGRESERYDVPKTAVKRKKKGISKDTRRAMLDVESQSQISGMRG